MSNTPLSAYLFVIDSSTMSRDDAIEAIDDISAVVNWMKILPDAAVLITPDELKVLNAALRERLPRQRFLLTLLRRGEKNGWLAKDAWEFINQPKSV